MEENKFYVYAYLDPMKTGNFSYGDLCFPAEPFYVGKGVGTRITDHLLPSLLAEHNHKNHRIKHILASNQKPILIKIKEDLPESVSYDLENLYIKTIGRRVTGDGPLTNIDEGGKQRPSMTDETKRKLSLALTGRIISSEWRNKISKNNARYWLGKHHTDNTIQKIRNKRKEQDMSHLHKSYRVISPSGEVTIIQDGLQKFCDKHNLQRGHMLSVASGKRKHHKGWKCYRESNGQLK